MISKNFIYSKRDTSGSIINNQFSASYAPGD